jgi:hypothetical protein
MVFRIHPPGSAWAGFETDDHKAACLTKDGINFVDRNLRPITPTEEQRQAIKRAWGLPKD